MHARNEFKRLVSFLFVAGTDRAPTADWLFWQLRELYREIPDLALTAGDVKEAFHASDRVCEVALRALVETRFLEPASQGQLVRATVSQVPA